jgi:hypothetical protein
MLATIHFAPRHILNVVALFALAWGVGSCGEDSGRCSGDGCDSQESADAGPEERRDAGPSNTEDVVDEADGGAGTDAGDVLAADPNKDAMLRALGPLVSAKVELVVANRPGDAVMEAETLGGDFDSAGKVLLEDVELSQLEDYEMYVARISGGFDLDPNYDGEEDEGVENESVTHVLLFGHELKEGGARASLLTELLWVYTRDLVTAVDPNGLRRRQDEVARWFIETDINGDGEINAADALAFDPARDMGHVSFDLDLMASEVEVGDDQSSSVIAAYRAGDEALLGAALDTLWPLNQAPPAFDYQTQARIQVEVFGPGAIDSDSPWLSLDGFETSQLAFDFFEPDEVVVLRAVPHEGGKLIRWRGCSEVSESGQECT